MSDVGLLESGTVEFWVWAKWSSLRDRASIGPMDSQVLQKSMYRVCLHSFLGYEFGFCLHGRNLAISYVFWTKELKNELRKSKTSLEK